MFDQVRGICMYIYLCGDVEQIHTWRNLPSFPLGLSMPSLIQAQFVIDVHVRRRQILIRSDLDGGKCLLEVARFTVEVKITASIELSW